MTPGQIARSNSFTPTSDPFINELRQEGRGDNELTPFLIKGSRWVRRDDFLERPLLPLQRANPVADRDEHIVVIPALRPAAYGTSVSGDNNCLVVCIRQDRFNRADRAIDASTGRVVDERIDAVPVDVAGMQHIRFRESDGNVTVGVRVRMVLE